MSAKNVSKVVPSTQTALPPPVQDLTFFSENSDFQVNILTFICKLQNFSSVEKSKIKITNVGTYEELLLARLT